MKRVAVTGASGHMGNNLCRALIEKGFEVKALIHRDGSSLENLKLFRLHADVLDIASLEKAFADVDAVFHLAGKISIEGDPDGSVMRVNVEGTKNVVEACLRCGVKRLVYFSASHVFQQEPLDEELDERRGFVGANAFPYERSKFQAELEVFKGIERGLDAVLVNPTSIIGPYDYKPSLLGKALIDLYNRRLSSIAPGGFDWVDARDVAHASIMALEKGKKGERYLLSGTWTTAKDLTVIAAEITGKKAPKFTAPVWLAKFALPFSKLYGKLSHSPPLYTKEALKVLLESNPNIKSRKARKELDYVPRPLNETVKDTYAWFKGRGRIY
jgi:dihydroflavonol-4-reductase